MLNIDVVFVAFIFTISPFPCVWVHLDDSCFFLKHHDSICFDYYHVSHVQGLPPCGVYKYALVMMTHCMCCFLSVYLYSFTAHQRQTRLHGSSLNIHFPYNWQWQCTLMRVRTPCVCVCECLRFRSLWFVLLICIYNTNKRTRTCILSPILLLLLSCFIVTAAWFR
jgi:hypothetical protein